MCILKDTGVRSLNQLCKSRNVRNSWSCPHVSFCTETTAASLQLSVFKGRATWTIHSCWRSKAKRQKVAELELTTTLLECILHVRNFIRPQLSGSQARSFLGAGSLRQSFLSPKASMKPRVKRIRKTQTRPLQLNQKKWLSAFKPPEKHWKYEWQTKQI